MRADSQSGGRHGAEPISHNRWCAAAAYCQRRAFAGAAVAHERREPRVEGGPHVPGQLVAGGAANT